LFYFGNSTFNPDSCREKSYVPFLMDNLAFSRSFDPAALPRSEPHHLFSWQGQAFSRSLNPMSDQQNGCWNHFVRDFA
jgi:hypothetical protein